MIINSLEEVIRQSGEGWLIDSFSPSTEVMNHIRGVLATVNERAQQRLGKNAPDLRESAIVTEYERHPTVFDGFYPLRIRGK